MAKVKVNLSLAADTADRLKAYADQHHTTVSQAVTDWIWREDVAVTRLSDKQAMLQGRQA